MYKYKKTWKYSKLYNYWTRKKLKQHDKNEIIIVNDFENITKKNSTRENFSNIKSINIIVEMFKSVWRVLQFDFLRFVWYV